MTFVEFATRENASVSLDISAEATNRFGFVFQDRVSTPKGPATVLGVSASGDLYFQLDSDSGCSYWGSCKSKADFDKRGFRVIPQDSIRRHRVKRIRLCGRDYAIVLQDKNGPCPLLAAVNALSLCGVQIPGILPDTELITQETICDAIYRLMLGDHSVRSQSPVNKIGSTITLSGLVGQIGGAKLKEYFSRIKIESLYQGLDVSPFFSDVADFEGEWDATFFNVLGLKIFHLWVVGEDDLVPSLRGKSFNQVQDVAVSETEASAEAIRFLNEHAAQSTELGILRLKQALREGEVAVLFNNNHFSTVVKLRDELLILVTDEGYGDKSLIVFEALTLTGDSSYRDGEGGVIEPIVLAMLDARGDQYSRRDILEAHAFLGENATIEGIAEVIESKHPSEGRNTATISKGAQEPFVPPEFFHQLIEMGFEESKCIEVCRQNPESMEVAVALLLGLSANSS